MSSYENTQAELKNNFLGLYMAVDFQCGSLIYSGNVTEGVKQMHRITSIIIELIQADKAQLKEIYEKLEGWMFNRVKYTDEEAIKLRAQLSSIIGKNLYSDLNLGLVQTASLKPTQDTPENKPRTNLTSRI